MRVEPAQKGRRRDLRRKNRREGAALASEVRLRFLILLTSLYL